MEEYSGGGFAEAGGDGDELGTAGRRSGRSRTLPGEAALIIVGGVVGGLLEEGVERKGGDDWHV